MFYLIVGSALCFLMSGILFKISKNYRKMCRLEPPDIIYKKNSYDFDLPQEILWQTPECSDSESDQAVGLFVLFVLRWGFFAGGSFLLAALFECHIFKGNL